MSNFFTARSSGKDGGGAASRGRLSLSEPSLRVHSKTPQPPFLVPGTIEPGCDTLSVLLKRPELSLSGTDAPLNATAITAFRVPAPLPDTRGLIGYRAVLRGTVRKSEGARITLAFNVNGAARTLEFPYDQEVEGEDTPLMKLFRWEWRSARTGGESIPPLVITITASSHRRTTDDTALLLVDGLDIRTVRPEPRSLGKEIASSG